MNALFFYSATGLMFGGGLILLLARRQIIRSVACTTIVLGLGLLAAGVGAWLIVIADGIVVVSLLVATWLNARKEQVFSETRTEHRAPQSISTIRRGMALLLPAALAGVLLSAVWSNSRWRVANPSEQTFTSPGVGLILYPLVLLLLFFLSYLIRRNNVREADRSVKGPTG